MNHLNAQLTHLMHLAVRLVVGLPEGQSQGPGIQLIFNKDWLTFSQERAGKGGWGVRQMMMIADEWEGYGPKSADIICRQHLTYNFGFSNTIYNFIKYNLMSKKKYHCFKQAQHKVKFSRPKPKYLSQRGLAIKLYNDGKGKTTLGKVILSNA